MHTIVARHSIELIDKNRAATLEVFHHVFVMHYFVTHKDWRPEEIDGAVHYIDGAIHPGTKAAGIGEVDGKALRLHASFLFHRFDGMDHGAKAQAATRQRMIEVDRDITLVEVLDHASL